MEESPRPAVSVPPPLGTPPAAPIAGPLLQPVSASPAAQARPAFLRAVWTVLWKDLVAEFRSREMLSAMVVFALLTVVIFNFALELRMDRAALIAPGLVWVTIVFAANLGLNRSLAVEKDRGSLDGLLLAPVDRSALYFGKMAGNLVFMIVVEIIVLPAAAIFLGLNLPRADLLLVLLLGTLGLAATGTLLSALAVHTRAREVMLPILLLPATVPLILAAVRASGLILSNAPFGEIVGWLNLLLVYDVIMLAVAYMTFDFVVEE
jgi:heme exporter protein B